MERKEFRALLDALMVSDPWPDKCFNILEDYANKVSTYYGYSDWIEAYHKLEAQPQ